MSAPDTALPASAQMTASGERRIHAAVFGKSTPELLAFQNRSDANAVRGDDELRLLEKDFLAAQFGLSPRRIVFLRQVHGDRVIAIVRDDLAKDAGGDANNDALQSDAGPASLYFADGDALFTAEPGVLLAIRTADCLPLFFELSSASADERDRRGAMIVGIVHAGWRGLAAGVIERTLTTALRELRRSAVARSAPLDRDTAEAAATAKANAGFRARFWIGPCIGADAYEVGEEVARNFTHKRAIPGTEKYLLDLAANARQAIARALSEHAREFDLDPRTLEDACTILSDFEGCTFQSNDLYFSHRRGDRGRNLNTILIEE